MVKTPIFQGSCTAIVTPFTEHGVDYERFKQDLAFQYENGTAAIVVCGTTGEAATLTQEAEHIFRRRQCARRGALFRSHAVAVDRAFRTDGEAMLAVQTISFEFWRDGGETIRAGFENFHDAVAHAHAAFHAKSMIDPDHFSPLRLLPTGNIQPDCASCK